MKKISLWLTILIILALTTGTALVLSIAYTNPKTLGPAGVTFWFINLLVFLSALTSLGVFMSRMFRKEARKNKPAVLSDSFRTGFLVGFCITVLVALSSLRSLGIRDIILFILTVVLIEIYFRTRKTQKQ
jgi:hypothetical protein